jgi:hypothetical protein
MDITMQHLANLFWRMGVRAAKTNANMRAGWNTCLMTRSAQEAIIKNLRFESSGELLDQQLWIVELDRIRIHQSNDEESTDLIERLE